MQKVTVPIRIASMVVSNTYEVLLPVKQTIMFDVLKSRNSMTMNVKSVEFEYEDLQRLMRSSDASIRNVLNHSNLVLKQISELGSPAHIDFSKMVDAQLSNQLYKKSSSSIGFEYIK